MGNKINFTGQEIMPIIKTTLILLLASLSFTPKAQYNEAMCILLKQQMHEYRNNTSHRNYRSAASNYEKNCQNPTPLNNNPALNNQPEQAPKVAPVTDSKQVSSEQHVNAISVTPKTEAQTSSSLTQQREPSEQLGSEQVITKPVPAEQLNTQVNLPTEQPELPVKADSSITPDEPTSNQLAAPVKSSSFEPENTPKVQEPATQTLVPVAEPLPTNTDNRSQSLLIPSLIVLAILLIAGLIILRIRQSKQSGTSSALEQSLLKAHALKAAEQAKAAKANKTATAAVLADEQQLAASSQAQQTSSTDFSEQQSHTEQELELANPTTPLGTGKQSDTVPDDIELTEPKLAEPSASSSYGYEQDLTDQPETDDKLATAEPDETELTEPKLAEPSASSSFGYEQDLTDQPETDDKPATAGPDEANRKNNNVPEYDLSSLVNDDLSFTDNFNKSEQTAATSSTTVDNDEINDDDLAKALQAFEQELNETPAQSVEPDEQNENKPKESPTAQEAEQQDDKQHNPFSNLSLDPSWDPSSDEKPVIASKTKQPKSQALIDAEERAKQLKTDD